jgi:DNA-binding HxlR family transcriptional regulator
MARSLDEVGDWWTFLIVRDSLRGISTFDGFRTSLGIATNVLAQRMRGLVATGLMVKCRSVTDGRSANYRLTLKGEALAPVLVALMQWGDAWISGEGNEPILLRDASTGTAIDPVTLSAAGQPVAANALRFDAGPGMASDSPKDDAVSNE